MSPSPRTSRLRRRAGLLACLVPLLLLQACAGGARTRYPYDRSCGCWKAPGGAGAADRGTTVDAGTREVGLASYYAEEFEGRQTASGEIFRSSGRTCAHRTWRFGTRLKVTSTKSGRSTEVVVNDRGPHVDGRVLDLSKGAAEDIGLDVEGVGEVTIEVLP